MANSPHLISEEVVNGRIFEAMWSYFVTPRGGCGMRKIFRIDRKTVKKATWEKEREAA